MSASSTVAESSTAAEAVMNFLNPWSMGILVWFGGWLVARLGVGFWDHLVIMLVKVMSE